MSERVVAAVNGVAERVSAAAGVPSVPGPASYRMEGVAPDDVARRILSGLVELEDVGPLLDHLEARVRQLMASPLVGGGCSPESWGERAASIFMSELQCVAVGVSLARGKKIPGDNIGPAPAAGDNPGFVV